MSADPFFFLKRGKHIKPDTLLYKDFSCEGEFMRQMLPTKEGLRNELAVCIHGLFTRQNSLANTNRRNFKV